MDITTVRSYRVARTRDDLVLGAGEVVLAGGTWLMSEPQPQATGLVDLTGMGWTPLEIDTDGLRIAATCTIAELVAFARDAPAEWTAAAMIPDAANALLASFKIWNTATVGGNVCRAFAAGAMVSLCVALDAVAEVWGPAGDRELAVADLVTGNGTTSLGSGEVLRGIRLPAHALRARAALRKIALAEHGRSGAVVTGRVDPNGASVFTITAATLRPTVSRFDSVPTAAALAAAVRAAPAYYSDPLGSADWRRGVSEALAEDIRRELA